MAGWQNGRVTLARVEAQYISTVSDPTATFGLIGNFNFTDLWNTLIRVASKQIKTNPDPESTTVKQIAQAISPTQ